MRIDLTGWPDDADAQAALAKLLHDPMTQSLLDAARDGAALFDAPAARRAGSASPLADAGSRQRAPGPGHGRRTRSTTCASASARWAAIRRRRTDDVRAGQFRALPAQDLQCQLDHRRPRDAARGRAGVAVRDDQEHPRSRRPQHTLSAYSDNAAVVGGYPASRFRPDPASQRYRAEAAESTARSASRSRPTTIRPRSRRSRARRPVPAARSATKAPPAAAASPKAGPVRVLGLAPAHPGPAAAVGSASARSTRAWRRRWTSCWTARSARAAFNNEFGRPNLVGYFRSFELGEGSAPDGSRLTRAYDKPIMLAGGLGAMDRTRSTSVRCRPAMR